MSVIAWELESGCVARTVWVLALSTSVQTVFLDGKIHWSCLRAMIVVVFVLLVVILLMVMLFMMLVTMDKLSRGELLVVTVQLVVQDLDSNVTA